MSLHKDHILVALVYIHGQYKQGSSKQASCKSSLHPSAKKNIMDIASKTGLLQQLRQSAYDKIKTTRSSKDATKSTVVNGPGSNLVGPMGLIIRD